MTDQNEPGATRALRIGVAGPVGTGKSSVIATLCRNLRGEFAIGVITNDIYTDEDARFLKSEGVLAEDRIRAVETGACPHTAIRDDVTMNLMAIEDIERDFAPLDLVFLESGGDNLTATFSPALVDAQLFVLDVAGAATWHGRAAPESAAPTCWSSTRSTWASTSTSTWNVWSATPRTLATGRPSLRSRESSLTPSRSCVTGFGNCTAPTSAASTPPSIRARWHHTSMPPTRVITITITRTHTGERSAFSAGGTPCRG